MRAKESHRFNAASNVLRWLVDRGGSCVAREAEAVIPGGSPCRVANAFDPLERAGHVEVHSPEVEGRKYAYGDNLIYVTTAGLLWRWYIDRDEEEVHGTRLDLFVRMRALEAALAPFVAVGSNALARRTGHEPNGLDFTIESKLGAVNYAIAAEILHPKRNSPVIYPWTPGNFKPKAPRLSGKRHRPAKDLTSSPGQVRSAP